MKGNKTVITVDQKKCIDEMHEVEIPKGLKDDLLCPPRMHTEFRSVLGMLNWLQSKTQFHVCYGFSRCASKAAAPR